MHALVSHALPRRDVARLSVALALVQITTLTGESTGTGSIMHCVPSFTLNPMDSSAIDSDKVRRALSMAIWKPPDLALITEWFSRWHSEGHSERNKFKGTLLCQSSILNS
jgi:hypothetical protein